MRLSNKIEIQDIELAKKIMFEYLMEMAVDLETGHMDIDIVELGESSSKRDLRVRMIEIVKECMDSTGVSHIDNIIKKAEEQGISETRTEEIIEKMKKMGDLIEPRVSFFKLM